MEQEREVAMVAVSNSGNTFEFYTVLNFVPMSPNRYIQVQHPTFGSNFLEVIGEQPNSEEWIDISNQLIEEGCTIAVLSCLDVTPVHMDFHVEHSNKLVRLTYETQEDGYHIAFIEAEIISIH